MNLLFPAAAFLLAAGFGAAAKIRMHRQVKIWSAAYAFCDRVRYALSGSCMPTIEILTEAADSSIGSVLTCLCTTLEKQRNGEDLYAAWEAEVAAFCKANGISSEDAVLLQKTVGMLGGLDLLGSCAAYDGLAESLRKRKELAVEKHQKQGTAAVKIGLLAGLGLALLLWQP